jgi:RNA polymerase sigma factor (sigma-70 family)
MADRAVASRFRVAGGSRTRRASGPHRQIRPCPTRKNLVRQLFERNQRSLLGYLTRKVGRDHAPDLLQETFLRFIQHSRIEAVAEPPPFLQQIATNLARDFARRRKTEAKYLEFGNLPENARSSAALPGARLEAEQQWRALCAVVEGLPPRCREVFTLYVDEALSLGEIAQRMGISHNMAQKHMRLALARCYAGLD